MNNTVMFKEIKESIERIPECSKVNETTLQELGVKINEFNPTNIVIAARGTSLHAGLYAKTLLELYYHKPVEIANKSTYTIYDTKMDLSHTLLIAISESGKGKDIDYVVTRAKEFGALTVAITDEHTDENVVAKHAMYNLDQNMGEAVAFAATKTFTASLYLITKLVYAITGNPELMLDNEKLMKDMNHALEQYDSVKELAKNFKDINNLFSLGRGLSFPIAIEFGLKLRETSNFHTSAYSAAEFYHGPMMMVKADTPVFITAYDKKTIDGAKEILTFLKGNFTKELYTITNNKELYDMSKGGILVDETNDLYAMFMCVVLMQTLVCETALIRGKNPDYVAQLDGNIHTF
jgi:glucosamine--fructose-6-phosphate aminotransferase (isomerizing)